MKYLILAVSISFLFFGCDGNNDNGHHPQMKVEKDYFLYPEMSNYKELKKHLELLLKEGYVTKISTLTTYPPQYVITTKHNVIVSILENIYVKDGKSRTFKIILSVSLKTLREVMVGLLREGLIYAYSIDDDETPYTLMVTAKSDVTLELLKETLLRKGMISN